MSETQTKSVDTITTTAHTGLVLLDTDVTQEVLDTLVTPYKAAGLVNQVLESLNINPVPPQMMYNYTTARVRAGKAPMIPTTDNKIKVADLKEWVAKYVLKKTTK